MTDHRHWCFLSWASLCGLWHFCLSPLRTLYLWSVFMSQEIISRFFAQLAVLGSDLDVTFPHPPKSTHFRKLIVSPNFLAYLFLNVGGTVLLCLRMARNCYLKCQYITCQPLTGFVHRLHCFNAVLPTGGTYMAAEPWDSNIHVCKEYSESIYFLSSGWTLWSGLHHRSLCSNDVFRLSGAFVVKITRCISTAVKM